MKHIKVLEVIDRAFLGGGQVNLLSLADSLSEKDFEVSICTEASGPLVREIKQRGLIHHPLDMTRSFRMQAYFKLKNILKEHQYDIIHTHGGVAGFYARSAAGKDRTLRVVHTQHGIHYLHYRNPVLKNFYIRLDRRLSKFTDRVIFVSEGDLNKAMKHKVCSPYKARVIKNGIDAEKLAAAVQSSEFPPEAAEAPGPVIGTVARLHYQKNIELFLSAVNKLTRPFPEITALVAGDGPERNRLEKMKRNLGLEKRVFFLGERKDIPSLLKSMDIFVLSSRWEGLPYALLEAGAAGKAVAATDVEGTREVIEPEQNGLLVPSEDAEALAGAVRRLLNNRNLASGLGGNLYRDVKTRFSLSGMVEQTRNLYIRLLQAPCFPDDHSARPQRKEETGSEETGSDLF